MVGGLNQVHNNQSKKMEIGGPQKRVCLPVLILFLLNMCLCCSSTCDSHLVLENHVEERSSNN